VRWRERDALPAGKPLRCRFYLRHAKLFSYAVRRGAGGE
jgi:hypothetical protein